MFWLGRIIKCRDLSPVTLLQPHITVFLGVGAGELKAKLCLLPRIRVLVAQGGKMHVHTSIGIRNNQSNVPATTLILYSLSRISHSLFYYQHHHHLYLQRQGLISLQLHQSHQLGFGTDYFRLSSLPSPRGSHH